MIHMPYTRNAIMKSVHIIYPIETILINRKIISRISKISSPIQKDLHFSKLCSGTPRKSMNAIPTRISANIKRNQAIGFVAEYPHSQNKIASNTAKNKLNFAKVYGISCDSVVKINTMLTLVYVYVCDLTIYFFSWNCNE